MNVNETCIETSCLNITNGTNNIFGPDQTYYWCIYGYCNNPTVFDFIYKSNFSPHDLCKYGNVRDTYDLIVG